MDNFAYYRPKTAEQAVGLLDAKWGTAELLAGGTDLVSLQKDYVARPKKVISVSNLGTEIALKEGALTIGAGVKLAAIAADKNVREVAAGLAAAADEIAGPQIRNMGTLGGSLCQRNRCWYFRDEEVVCLLKGGDKCYAIDGENRYHACFTKGHKCIIASPSTLGPVLIALGATAEVAGPNGKRTVEMAKFFKAPNGPNDREHVLEPNELLLSVTVKGVKNGRSASYEVRQKQAIDWPLVQAAVALTLDGKTVKKAKVVLGHVAPTPLASDAAAEAIEGKEVTEATAAAAGEAAVKAATPKSQNAYKVRLLSVAVKRALLLASGAKPYWEV